MTGIRPLQPGDAGWIVMRHGEYYAQNYGFGAEFEALVAEILATYLRDHKAPRERAWIATDGTRRLGSIFCVEQSEDVAKLRLFFLEPQARGQGLGRRLITHCLSHARAQGFSRMELWTHAEHSAACALYAKVGFTCMSSRAVTSFGVDLTEQMWGRDL